MAKIAIPDNNKYFPQDTQNVFQNFKIGERDNFFYLFNSPRCFLKKNKLTIQVNEEIELFKWEKTFLKFVNKRRYTVISEYEINGYKKEEIEKRCSWRLVVGHGASHPQEISMTLHHIYGIPYIPGGAVKGVTRHWIILSKFGNNEKNAEQDEAFQKIFGTQKQQGNIIFMDALSINEANLKLDIMNPHYPDYYSNNIPPADWQQPKPIKFLTVERTTFHFVLLSKDECLIRTAKEWLEDALKNFGIGAKTSLGYGIFEFDS